MKIKHIYYCIGIGSIYMSQVLNFKKPVYVGDEIIATVTITKIQKERKVITLDTKCSVMRQKVNEAGVPTEEEEIVIDGEAVIYYPLLDQGADKTQTRKE